MAGKKTATPDRGPSPRQLRSRTKQKSETEQLHGILNKQPLKQSNKGKDSVPKKQPKQSKKGKNPVRGNEQLHNGVEQTNQDEPSVKNKIIALCSGIIRVVIGKFFPFRWCHSRSCNLLDS